MKKSHYACMAAMLLFISCYTLIKHPEIRDQNDRGLHHEIYFSDDCSDCHSARISPIYYHSYTPKLNYIHKNERWHSYYGFPWWYRDRFLSNPIGESKESTGNNTLPTTSARPRFPGMNSTGNNSTSSGNTIYQSGSSANSAQVSGNKNNNTQQNTKVRKRTDKNQNKNSNTRTRKNNKSGNHSRKNTRRQKK